MFVVHIPGSWSHRKPEQSLRRSQHRQIAGRGGAPRRQKIEGDVDTASLALPVLASNEDVSPPGSLGRSLQNDVGTIALYHYMHENGAYSARAADLLRPFDSFFTTEYTTQVPNHPSFRLASEALTLLDYSNEVRSPDIKTKAILQYSLAMRSVQQCIDDPLKEKSRFKSLLDSIWVMTQVEAKLHTKTSAQNCRTHMKGIFDIIDGIGSGIMDAYKNETDVKRKISGVKKLGASLDELTLLSLQTGQEVPKIGTWVEHLLTNGGLPEQLSLIASRIPALHVRANRIMAHRTHPNDLNLVVADAIDLDCQLLDWRKLVPAHWTTTSYGASLWTKIEYANLPSAILINQWRVWRIHIYTLVLQCVDGREDTFGLSALARAELCLRKLAEGICDSASCYSYINTNGVLDKNTDPDVPSLSIRASKLLGLLLLVQRIPGLPDFHQRWLDQEIDLLRMGGSFQGVNSSITNPFPVESAYILSLR